MYNFKKITAVLLSAVMLSGLTACGNTDASEETGTPDTTAADTSAAADDTPDDSADARVYAEGNKFMVNGKELWINGVNTPWDKWNDFGSTKFDPEFWDTHFAELAASGVNASRVWINCSSMQGVRMKTTGEVKEVTEKHWQDVDKLFEIAEKHGIYIMATMISFDHFKDSNGSYENWRNMITTEEGTTSFVNDYIVPFVQRYDDNDYLWSIDLCNEIDWVYENAECGKIGWEHICNYFADASAAIHENSDVLVTAGMGMIKYNSNDYQGNYLADDYLKSLGNENSYMDFYSPHYYFWQKTHMGYPFDVTPEEFKLENDRPCVIGETPADFSEIGKEVKEAYENSYSNGWNGVMAWTSNGVDNCGDLTHIAPATERMLELIPEKVRPLEN